MRQYIQTISQEFIRESLASPRMLEDLSAMERYMAESYDGRTFIELIQNADDAQATRIKVLYCDGSLIVANDGRPFNQNDILAICRSGSSQKQRGVSIGYRGVGFKSTTSISTEIVIYSANVYFSFSKKHCADKLNFPVDKVPAVRVPFLYDENGLGKAILRHISMLERDGNKTIFVFRDDNFRKFKAEFLGFQEDWLIFLHNIESISISLGGNEKIHQVKRLQLSTNEHKVACKSGISWYLVSDDTVSFAFQYGDKGIMPCMASSATFHCYLPTIDRTGFPFKINADFSTDPSRKHIIADGITENLLVRAQELLTAFITRIACNEQYDLFPVIRLLQMYVSVNDLSEIVRHDIYKGLSSVAWIKTSTQEFVKPSSVKFLPAWLSNDEKDVLYNISEISRASISKFFQQHLQGVENLLTALNATAFSDLELLTLLCEQDYCNLIDLDLHAKIFGNGIKNIDLNADTLGDVWVPVNDSLRQLRTLCENERVDTKYIQALSGVLTLQEIKRVCERFPALNGAEEKKILSASQRIKKLQPSSKNNLAINKWKKPVQNCIAVEALAGNTAKDVSRTENGYNIISTSPSGDSRYIAVKQVPVLGDSFVLSEAEYEAAQRLGNEYAIFIITSKTNDIEFGYIENPYQILQLERKVKEWEWLCDVYSLNKASSDEPPSETLLDENVLKKLSKDYFNSEQKKLLLDLIASEKCAVSGRNDIVAGQINNISDFYLGRSILDVGENHITVANGLNATIKRLFE